MKRRDLLRHLEGHGCEVLRDKGPHTVYVHREINDFLVRKICRDLQVPEP